MYFTMTADSSFRTPLLTEPVSPPTPLRDDCFGGGEWKEASDVPYTTENAE